MRSRPSSGSGGGTRSPRGGSGTWRWCGFGGSTWSLTCGSPPYTGSTRTWTSSAPSWCASPARGSATAGKPAPRTVKRVVGQGPTSGKIREDEYGGRPGQTHPYRPHGERDRRSREALPQKEREGRARRGAHRHVLAGGEQHRRG